MSRIDWVRLDEIADRLVDRLARNRCKRIAQVQMGRQDFRGGGSEALPGMATRGTVAANDNACCEAGQSTRDFAPTCLACDLSSHRFR